MADPATASLPDNMALDGFDTLSVQGLDQHYWMQSNMECVYLSLLQMVMGDDGILGCCLCMLAA